MFIARGTVKVHLSHVFAKLGISTRAELAAQAMKRADTTKPNLTDLAPSAGSQTDGKP